MKKILLIAALAMACLADAAGQKIVVKSFGRSYTSLRASTSPEEDKSGTACAVIRLYVRDAQFEVTPNLGTVRREVETGEIRLWVPQGTKWLTIRHAGMIPLRYKIPMSIVPKVTYEAVVDIAQEAEGTTAGGWDIGWFAGAGYSITGIQGPSLTLGIDVNHHQIEVGGTIGLNKTDNLYFYTAAGATKAAYSYTALRGSLRYGYDVDLSEMFHLIPQAGLAFQQMTGKGVASVSSDNTFKSSGSMSALVAVRMAVRLGDWLALHVTPEYDFGLQKDGVGKLISSSDDTFKGWTEGLSLNAGLLINF